MNSEELIQHRLKSGFFTQGMRLAPGEVYEFRRSSPLGSALAHFMGYVSLIGIGFVIGLLIGR